MFLRNRRVVRVRMSNDVNCKNKKSNAHFCVYHLSACYHNSIQAIEARAKNPLPQRTITCTSARRPRTNQTLEFEPKSHPSIHTTPLLTSTIAPTSKFHTHRYRTLSTTGNRAKVVTPSQPTLVRLLASLGTLS